jgi:uncharacterized protein (TIGR02231 family)
MRSSSWLVILLTAVHAAHSRLNAQQPGNVEAAGAVTDVTLYQGTALVTRLVEIDTPNTGAFEILVTGLPSATDPASVFADNAEGLDIRSVAFRNRPPAKEEELKGQVADLDKAIRELRKKVANSRNEIALRRIRQEFLKNLGNFVAPAATQEMTHGVLQAGELEKVTQMHFREYETASQEIMNLDFAIEDDESALERLQAERQKLASGPPIMYDAVVSVDKAAAGKARLNVNYLVKDCGWLPVYNVRGSTEAQEVEIEFNALIHQVSGEDWKTARLALSTASPTVSAFNPQLTPLHVGIDVDDEEHAQQASAPSSEKSDAYNRAVEQKRKAVAGQLRGNTFGEMAAANFAANDSAASVQLIELSQRMSDLRTMRAEMPDDDLSIQYVLPKQVTLVSRREGQTVPVLRHLEKARFYYVSAPILTSSVFREAELTNATGRDLLGGQVNVYLDGEFTGRTEIPSIARGRNLTLGFGVDGQLRARRSVMDRQETVQGGNRKIAISSQVIIDNYKDKPIDLRLRERTPFMADTASLRVNVAEMSHPLSEDPDYKRFQKPKGVLLWDLTVAPGHGDKATTLTYAYSLEYDKNMVLQEITNEEKSKLRDDFINESRKAKM